MWRLCSVFLIINEIGRKSQFRLLRCSKGRKLSCSVTHTHSPGLSDRLITVKTACYWSTAQNLHVKVHQSCALTQSIHTDQYHLVDSLIVATSRWFNKAEVLGPSLDSGWANEMTWKGRSSLSVSKLLSAELKKQSRHILPQRLSAPRLPPKWSRTDSHLSHHNQVDHRKSSAQCECTKSSLQLAGSCMQYMRGIHSH